MRKFFLGVICAIVCASHSFSQGEANIWYFGQNVGLDFTDPANPQMLSNGSNTVGVTQGGEGTSSICNAAGDLLFYTDGDRIFNGNHVQIANINSNQDISQNVIFPDPEVAGQYYLVYPETSTPNAVMPAAHDLEGLTYTRISASTTADAAVINTTTFYNSLTMTQGLAVVPDDVDGYWLIGRNGAFSNNILVWHFTNTGLVSGTPTSTSIGGAFPADNDIVAIKANSCSNKIGFTYFSSGGGMVEVYDFDNSTGLPTGVANSFAGVAEAYGLEFSPSDRYLYVTQNTQNSLLQFDLNTNTQVQVGTENPGGPNRNGHLQLGPDKKIYVSYYSRWGADGGYIGVINNPDVAGAGCNHVPNAYDWGVTGVGPAQGLPPILRSFVSSVAALKIDGIDAASTTVCEGESVWLRVDVDGTFTGGVNWVIDEAIDGISNPAGDSVLWVFDNVGNNVVQVDVTDNCGNNVAVDVDIDVTAYEAATAVLSCGSGSGGNNVLTGNGSSTGNYVWHDGDPNAGGNIIAIGTPVEFDPAVTSVWVSPYGGVSSTEISADYIGAGGGGFASGDGDFTINTTGVSISSFEFTPYSYFAAFDTDTWTAELYQGATQIGSTVSGSFSLCSAGAGNPCTDVQLVSPTDWVDLPAGNYTIEIRTTGASAVIATGCNCTSNNSLFNMGTNQVVYNLEMSLYEDLKCVTPVEVPISCCTAPGATVTIANTVVDTLKACDDTTMTASVVGGGNGNAYQWYSLSGTTLTAMTGAGNSGTVNAGQTLTSPTVTADGFYVIKVASSVANLSSCADGDTVYVLVTTTPSAPSVTAVSICTGQALNLAVNSANTDYTYNWTGPNAYTATGATQTVIANATITPTDYSGNHPVTATENGCTSTASNLAVTLTQSPTVTVNVDTTFCAYPFDLANLHGAPSNGTISYLSNADATIASTVNADGTYKIVVTDNGCADTTEVTTTETGDPVASWSGGTGICVGNSTDLTVTISGGSGDYTVYYTDGSSIANAILTATGETINLGAGVYTLDSIVDNNGCSHLNIGDTETISTQADIAATVTTLCDGDLGVNGVLNFDEFQLMVDITAGDTANVSVEEVAGTFGINFTEVPANSGLWFSDPIKEDTTLDIRVRDTRCDTVTGSYNRVCSCPGVITISGDTAICNNGEAQLTLTLDGVGPFDFELQQNGTVYNGATLLGVPYGGSQTNVPLLGSPTTVTIVVADSGTYTIANLIDNGSGACEGSEIGAELVAFYTHPDGDIGLDPTTGENPICLDGNTDVDIEVTAGGVGPFTAYYTDNGSQSTGATTGTGIGTINITADTGTVVLDSIVDVNGCASPINESLTITAHDTLDVTATIVCDEDASTPLLPNDGFYIEVTTATGVIQTVTETTGNGLTFNNVGGTWTSGITNENNSVDIQVTDDNGCHTVTVTGLQQTCSCPTAVVLGYATNGEACAGDDVTLQIDTTAGNPAGWTDATVSVTGPNGVELNNVTIPSIPHQFTVSDSGEYTLTVFTDNGEGCDAQINDDTATAKIYSLPTGILSGGGIACIGGTVPQIDLTLTGAGSSWDVDYTHVNTSGTNNNSTTVTAITSTLINATSTEADSGTYTITGIDMTVGNVTCSANNPSSSQYIQFTTPPSVIITGGGTYCDTDAPDTIIAEITPGSSGISNWTLVYYQDGAGTTTRMATSSNPHHFITSSDLQIRIDSIYEGSCGAAVVNQDETITYVATPIPSFTVTSDTCEGSQITAVATVINGYSGMVYNWDIDGVTASETYPDSNYSFTVNLPVTGTTVPVNLSVDAPAACGSATQTATTQNVTVIAQHGATITTGDLDICMDSVGTLVANDEGAGVTYNWTLNSTSVSSTSSVGVTNAAGLYTLTTSSAECPDRTATATVTVTEITVTAVATPEIVSEGDNITFSSITNGTSCEWFDPSLNSIGANCTESYEAPAPGGFYTVISTDGQCVGTDQVEVTVIQPIRVPDAFTPNDDQINDNFTITGINTYDGATISIYNRWGNLVYYMYGGDNYAATPWDGKVNGKELPAGVYYYTVDLGLSLEQAELVPDSAPISGSVMLFK